MRTVNSDEIEKTNEKLWCFLNVIMRVVVV